MDAEEQKDSGSRARHPGCWIGVAVALASTGLIVTVAAILMVGAWTWASASKTNAGKYEFTNELAIPPLLEPEIDSDGRKVFDLAFQSGTLELSDGRSLRTWGLNGPYLGPTIRAERGDEVKVNVQNGLNEATTLHWHGMHLPAEMDGGPHQKIEPWETWSPEWTIDQPAATLWYHPHTHEKTAEHVYRGAAGMFIIDDPELDDLAIPSDYGVDDIPLIIQDRRVSDGGLTDRLARFMRQNGVLGDELLVNGTHAPVFDAETSLVRFRVVNASVARVYDLRLSDRRAFSVIGSDGGLLESPVSMTRLQISPGERVEIVVELEPGDDLFLRSEIPDLGVDFWTQRMEGGDDLFDILRIRAADDLATSDPLPEELITIDRPDVSDAVRTRTFGLHSTSSINGQSMDLSRIDEVVEVNTTEIWEVSNGSAFIHNFHIHLVHFLILDIDGSPPPEHLRGWKDTVYIPRGSTVRLLVEFRDHANSEVPYMYHCHILRHEDKGMMGQFLVVEPGDDVPEYIRSSGDRRHHHD